MSLVIIGYSILFFCTPILVRNLTLIDPLDYTNEFVNKQAFTDLVHVCTLTSLVFTGNTKTIPLSVFVYFVLDVVFNFNTFIIHKSYVVHHIFGCFQLYIIYKYFMENVETLGFLIWVEETALVPMSIMSILRMQSMKIPQSLYILRACWYFSTRLYTYVFLLYNYDQLFADFDKNLMILFLTPLILHNANIFKIQIKLMLRVFRS